MTATWFITGCSSGLGHALAEAVVSRGDNAVVTARETIRIQSLAERRPDTVLPLALDLSFPAHAAAAVHRAQQRFGSIDVLVNNAGYGYRAAVEEGDDADVRRLFATNLHGPVALMKAVLPAMRARRSGTIVNISSIGARVHQPGSGYYSASKAALESISASLRQEVEPLGITVTTVEPGAFRTDFAGRSLTQSATPIGDYAATAGRRRKENDTTHGTQPGDPARAAEAIITAVTSGRAPALLLLGSDAVTAVSATLDRHREEIDQWRQLSLSTDYPG
ncbi:oxidoreductase [Actinoplanes sichuanensis]|uniref:Oxidoreductase n=1 Tax=Actinoplanes sichuanensis TaxID=512349 RepID=A0ABW4AKG3_9ACTN|nr:oxidoreductase [Actinoplanes sichuanensis]BEL03757.1 oxidoreductase [Actinoplanes sichuanensis]